MSYPKLKIANSEIDLKLGIKSSLPNATQAIVLAYLIWRVGEKSTSVSYSQQNGDALILKPQVYSRISDLMNANIGGFNNEVFRRQIQKNPLLKAQIEALIVGFELVWKLARLTFVDKTLPFAKERTGGKRFEKVIAYTSNIDILDLLVQSNEKGFLQFFYEVLTESEISNKVVFDSFRKLLTVFSETAVYKIKTDTGDLIFDNLGIYKSLNEDSVVNLSGVEENKGSSRILKSSITEGLNYYITSGNGGFVKDDSHSNDLSNYAERVENFLILTQIKLSFDDKNEIETKIENEITPSSPTPHTQPKQIIFYGVPGCGKSHKISEILKDSAQFNIESEEHQVVRTVFHPDYTNSDFVGQILPKINDDNGNKTIEYSFVPGPFTKILANAYKYSQNQYVLIIEEINRGNAVAIFGEIFQLLDRIKTGKTKTENVGDNALNTYGEGWSEYFFYERRHKQLHSVRM